MGLSPEAMGADADSGSCQNRGDLQDTQLVSER